MITTVSIAGAELDPGTVEATALIVMHGRAAAGDPPTASSATIVLRLPTHPGWTTADPITLTGAGPYFTGRISDLTLTHEDDPDRGRLAVVTVTATGALADLATRDVGAEPWPTEPGTARAARILTAAGVPYRVEGTDDLTVLPLDVDKQPALTLLADLATSTGAAVFDTPDGTVVYQALSGRQRPVGPYRWQDWPPDLAWSGIDPALTWAGITDWHSADSIYPIPIPPEAVEYEPAWVTTAANITNHARIGYGPADPQQAWAEALDPGSVDRYGIRYAYTGTTLADETDAQARAGLIVTLRGRQRWALGDVTVWPALLPVEVAADLETALCGRHITITGLPGPAPAIDWTGILEGYAYRQETTPDGITVARTLLLSDPLESAAAAQWSDYPPLYAWADHPGHITWDDLTAVPA